MLVRDWICLNDARCFVGDVRLTGVWIRRPVLWVDGGCCCEGVGCDGMGWDGMGWWVVGVCEAPGRLIGGRIVSVVLAKTADVLDYEGKFGRAVADGSRGM